MVFGLIFANVAADYGASAIPRTILIGPDGRVIAKDLRGERTRSPSR